MSILEAIILGIIQGLTEFLPISSTAHVTIAGQLMQLISSEHPEQWTAFIAVIQLGTMAAVIVYFSRDITGILRDFWRENIQKRRRFSEQSVNARLGWYVVLGSVPIAVIGLTFKKLIEGEATKEPLLIASSLIVLALIMAIAERRATLRKSIGDIGLKDAMLVGFAQCLALVPGSSRSGTTITAGLFLGMNREVAARFSFLLSIPAVLGSGLLEFVQSLEYLQGDGFLTLGVATLASAVSGYAAIAFLLRFLRRHTTMLFIVYRIILGLALFWLTAMAII